MSPIAADGSTDFDGAASAFLELQGMASVGIEMGILLRLYRDESGAIISTEYIGLLSFMLVATILGVFLVRAATLKVFMGVATDVASEQTHVFDLDDADVLQDDNHDNDRFGYQAAATPGNFDFDQLGSRPVEITSDGARHEGQ